LLSLISYVKGDRAGRSFIFTVPYDGCGSKPSCSVCASIENILIIQDDRDIQNSFDIARKISCSRGDEREKTVYFKPFVVDMLEVISVDTPSGPVECWMEIGTGTPPNIRPIQGTLTLGTDITFTINVKHAEQAWDINILQCYASDDMDFEARTTKRLQLSDKRGCSIKEKIFGEWRKFAAPSSLTSTYYNTLKAFRFPDRSQVYLKCDIELCNGACKRDYTCGVERSGPCPEGSTDPQCLQDHLISPKPRCYPGSREPGCPTPTSLPPTTIRIPIASTFTPRPRCYPGSNDPSCPQTTQTTSQPSCPLGSTDPRCRGPPATIKPRCYPGSNDPACQPATYLPPTTRRTPAKPRCYPGSTDPDCQPATRAPATTLKPRCYPGSDDPECGPKSKRLYQRGLGK